jgi:hypothetical protein
MGGFSPTEELQEVPMKVRSSILFALIWFDLGMGAVEVWHFTIDPALLHSLWLVLAVFFLFSLIADALSRKKIRRTRLK